MKKATSRRSRKPPAGDPADSGEPASAPLAFPIVGVGASAGGMEAFSELLRHVPAGSGMAFVLIQHLDPTRPSYLSEALARSTSFPVCEALDGTPVEPDHVYVIPSDADIGILNGTLVLLPRTAEERRPHLPIDFFFNALAADLASRAIGVVLSGTGSDGSEGLRAIKAEDGVTFAQDPRTAKFSGMPEAAVRTGAVDFCLPIPELARELLRIGRHPFLREPQADELATPKDDGVLEKVLLLVRNAAGVDFSEYKPASIRRRLSRRMALRRVTTPEEYVRLLREDRAEVQALFDDILIHVTSFFRDGGAFEKLKEHAFPAILRRKRQGGAIRIWSAGCSTGEEAYSLVIALLEFLAQENASDVPIQLFGTDISERAIDKARAGVFPDGSIRELSAERLAHFFTQVEGGGYRISKSVRDRCAFVKHNLATDPPFSMIDLVCCRNVLIYFGQELQKRVLANFHFALSEPGFLLLGHAENIADGTNLFRLIDRERKIFARTAVKSTLRLAPARDVARARPPAEVRTAPDIVRRTESLLLEQYAPPGVIVNGRWEILLFRGRTGPYLEPAPGQPHHDLLKMARKGLVADLRIAVSQARKQQAAVRRPGVRVEQNGSSCVVDVVVFPVASPPEFPEEVFAVLFEHPASPEPPTGQPRPGAAAEGPATADAGADQRRFARLEDELSATKEYLQSIIGEHQRANEELLSANEELVSSNEELQSLNEELQTAKEELQSTNEELSTLNEELHTRNTELDSANGDLINILGSVEVPIVIVDGERRIRRFTPKARPILNLLPADVGRPVDDIKPNLAIVNLDQKIADVIDTVAVHEEEVQGREGRWYRLQIRPYTTVDKRIDGAILSVVDIDVLKRALGAAEWARDYAQSTVEAVQVPLVVLDDGAGVVSANRAFEDRYGPPRTAAGGRSGVLDAPAVQSALDGVRFRGEIFDGLEFECDLAGRGQRTLLASARSVAVPGGGRLILLAVEDVTERRNAEADKAKLLQGMEQAKASAEEANRTKDLFLATLSHELRTPLSSLLLSAQLLRKAELDEATLRKTAEAIERAAKVQAQLIDDLLDISRIVTGKLRIEQRPVRLASVVQAAVDTVLPTAERKRIDLEVRLDDTLSPVSGDPVRLQQLVSNLLTNAIKFTPEGGRVTVSVDHADGRGRLCVRDNGVGIEPDFLPHIFSRFSQEDSGQTRTRGGLGLGLAIVRYLVEAHGGTVHAESAGRGKGATFTVSLPLMKVSDIQRHEREAPPPDAEVVGSIEGVRVLVVEDDRETREALTKMLGLSGADVRSAESAAMAMTLFEELTPEVIVCDIAMPGEDGYSFLRRIRARGSERGGDVPALALTALAGDEHGRRAVEAGFQMHVAKPVDIEHLLVALTRLREGHGTRTEHTRRPALGS